MGSIPHELSLDIRPSFVPKTISEFLGELTTIPAISEKKSKIDDFVQRLEEEMRKIDAFKRELPLCMLLTNDAILKLKDESAKCKKRIAEPVLEEFIPLKKNYSDEGKNEDEKENDSRDKMNWMSSVQLWNTDDSKKVDSTLNQKKVFLPNLIKGNEDLLGFSMNRGVSRVFLPFKEEMELPVAGLSLFTPGIDHLREEVCVHDFNSNTNRSRAISSSTPNSQSNLRSGPQQQSGRKQRRCWSPELHRLFVDALEKLGGSQVATPKQIRDLMQVDGLTNDEVKSHLQKYRLHTRRIPSCGTSSSSQSLINLGGLWMQQEHCGESSKQSSSQSGSPTGPLQLSKSGGRTSTSSIEEEEEDERSESYGWKNQVQKSGKKDSIEIYRD